MLLLAPPTTFVMQLVLLYATAYMDGSGPVRAVVRPGVTSFEGPIGPKNTSTGEGSPLRLARPAPFYILGPLLYLGARGK